MRLGSVLRSSLRVLMPLSSSILAATLFRQLSCRHCCFEVGHIRCLKLFARTVAFAVAASRFWKEYSLLAFKSSVSNLGKGSRVKNAMSLRLFAFVIKALSLGGSRNSRCSGVVLKDGQHFEVSHAQHP